MPLVLCKDETWYETPTLACAHSWDGIEVRELFELKKSSYNWWQEFKKLLQQAHKEKWGADCIEIFKEREAYNRKIYRACTYIIPWLHPQEYPGDCKKTDSPRPWPPDLANSLDYVFDVLMNLK